MTKGPVIVPALSLERRKAIFGAYNALEPGKHKTDEIIYFVRKQCQKNSLSHFLDTASDVEVRKLERLLKK